MNVSANSPEVLLLRKMVEEKSGITPKILADFDDFTQKIVSSGNGNWVIDDIVVSNESTKKGMKNFINRLHNDMLLSEVAKMPGVVWMADTYTDPMGHGFGFRIRVKHNKFNYDTTADFGTIYQSDCSEGLTDLGVQKILSAVKGKGIRDGIIIKVAPEYFNREGKVVVETGGD